MINSMFPVVFSILSSVLFLISTTWYTMDAIKGRVTVSVGTFAVLSVVTGSQGVALLVEGAYLILPFSIIGFVANVAICVVGLRDKNFYFKRMDAVALIGAFAGLAAWYATSDALMNLYILTGVMIISVAPLIIKTFNHPDMETRLPWVINLIASACLVLTITTPAPEMWLVPIRQFIFSTLMNVGLRKRSLRSGGHIVPPSRT
jgi:hypothetical protein